MFLQGFLGGLKNGLVELLGEFLRGEAVPRLGAPVDGVGAVFGLQGEWRPQAVQQAGALLADGCLAGPPGLVWVDSWRRRFLWS